MNPKQKIEEMEKEILELAQNSKLTSSKLMIDFIKQANFKDGKIQGYKKALKDELEFLKLLNKKYDGESKSYLSLIMGMIAEIQEALKEK